MTSEETKEEVQNAEGPASESAQAGETQIIEDSETAKSDTAPELVRDDAAEAVAAIPVETKKFPVVPVLVVTGIAAILAAAVAVAAKKGILAKILADLHIVK